MKGILYLLPSNRVSKLWEEGAISIPPTHEDYHYFLLQLKHQDKNREITHG